MTEPTLYIEDLTPTELELLTQLLCLKQTIGICPSWLHHQRTLISTFPPSLLKPSSLLQRMLTALSFAPSTAHLCPSHSSLNAVLIRRIFLELSAECTTHLSRLTSSPSLPLSLAFLVKRLQAVNSLWMSPDLHRAMFLPTPEDAGYEPIASGCEACILACVGGNHYIVSDLRASMRGRKKRGRPHAVFLPMVETWIDWTGRADELRKESGRLGREMNGWRREIQKERWRAREGDVEFERRERSESRTLVDEPVGSIGEKREEELVADYYATKMSSVTLLLSTIEDIHPAFRNSVVFDSTTGTCQRMGAQVKGDRTTRPYSASMYSSNDAQVDQPAERHARAYQDLLAKLEDDEEPRGGTRSRDERPESLSTR